MPRGKRSAFASPTQSAAEQVAMRADFARRLRRQLILKGWTHAELSRRMRDRAEAEGKSLRVGADSISHYINGRYLPSRPMMVLLAEALEVDIRELIPTSGEPEADEPMRPSGVQSMPDGSAWLRINQAVPWPVALKVLEMIHPEKDEDQPPKG